MARGRPGRPRLAQDPVDVLRRDRGRAAWNRLKDPNTVIEQECDPRKGAQLTRLWLEHELTGTQVEAGLTVARIYGEYERSIGARQRSAASPEYDRAYGGSATACECDELVLAERRAGRDVDQERLCHACYRAGRAKKRMKRLADLILDTLAPDWVPTRRTAEGFFVPAGVPPVVKRARDVLEALCVDDIVIHSSDLPGIRVLLDAIALEFGLRATKQRPTRSIAVSRDRRPQHAHSRSNSRTSTDKTIFFTAMAQQHPDFSQDQIEADWRRFQEARSHQLAIKDRAKFRADKHRRRA